MKNLENDLGKVLGIIIAIGFTVFFLAAALHKLLEKTQKKNAK